jgi:hypothetical protein
VLVCVYMYHLNTLLLPHATVNCCNSQYCFHLWYYLFCLIKMGSLTQSNETFEYVKTLVNEKSKQTGYDDEVRVLDDLIK